MPWLKCPLGDLKTVRKDGYAYYRGGKEEAGPNPWPNGRPSSEQLRAVEEGELFKMSIDGQRWVRVPLNPTWTLARDDANFPGDDPNAPAKTTPRHIHCDLLFSGDWIHIDFLRFVEGGPLSGFEEFQFFVNGEFRSRGGYYVCYASRRRAMPACLRTSIYAVIADGYTFSHTVLPPFTGLSVWLIESREGDGNSQRPT